MNYYNEIKETLLNNEINKHIKKYSINRSDLNTNYNVGKLLFEAGKHYGENIIKNYSIKLINEVGKKYNTTTLKRMRQFYLLIQKGAPFGHQLTWSHYRELLPLKNIDEVKYYINISIRNNLTRDELREKIKSKEYERIDQNVINKIINNKETEINEIIPNPIIIKNDSGIKEISEKVLHRLILEDIEQFMNELGSGYAFIGSEYKIKIGNEYNYIDLLLFNVEYNCYVVVELKTTKLKKEHIGQIQVYMNYIDENVKKINQDRTIGLIICKEDNKYIIKYCSDKRIIARSYEVI